jgi:anti-sigma regulatory factor (Ser/Thr protein kinase)
MICCAELAEADPGILADLRSSVRALLSEHPTESPTESRVIEAAELIVTELVRNALTHGAPAGQARLELVPGQLRIEVTDHCPAPVHRLGDHARPPRPGDRGLPLVNQLASAWGWSARTPDGKTVWAHLDLTGTDRPAPS